jgi:CheY-like chemotaxis protein
VNTPKSSILLVEDHVDLAQSLSAILEMNGFDVHVAHDGLAALEIAKGVKLSAAVVDITLPAGMDGYEVGGRLRSACGPALRLFALTGQSGPEPERRASAAGFDAYMVKPVDVEQLTLWLRDDVTG